MDTILHHLQNHGMIQFPCKYQLTMVTHGLKVVRDFVHPQYIYVYTSLSISSEGAWQKETVPREVRRQERRVVHRSHGIRADHRMSTFRPFGGQCPWMSVLFFSLAWLEIDGFRECSGLPF